VPVTPSDAREIAQAIVDGSIWKNWAFYALVLGGSFIASTAGSFLGSYLKKRGEHLATKADSQAILDQLRASTRAAEGIRAEIESQHGEAATLRNIVRDRLEILVTATFDLELWLEQMRNKAIEGEVFDVESGPITKIEALQSIHFPELDPECLQLRMAINRHIQWLLRVLEEAMATIARARAIGGQLQIPELDNFDRVGRETREALRRFRTRLIEVGRPRGGLLPPAAN
jgi:hypothetical protein